MSSNMERVAAMPDASLYVNRDGERADDCVDSHGGGNLTKIPRSGGDSQKTYQPALLCLRHYSLNRICKRRNSRQVLRC